MAPLIGRTKETHSQQHLRDYFRTHDVKRKQENGRSKNAFVLLLLLLLRCEKRGDESAL
jgi:hypothetical protein